MLFAGIALPAAMLMLMTRLLIPSQRSSVFFLGIFATLAARMIGEAVASGATAFAVSAVHLNKPISIVQTYRMLKVSFSSILGVVALVNFRALWVFALAGLMGAIAAVTVPPLLILAFLTGIIAVVVACVAYCIYALAVPACAVEQLSVKQSLLRSRTLTDGIGKQIVLIYLFAVFISLLASEVLMAPQSLPASFGFGALLTGTSKAVWENLALFFSDLLTGPVLTIAFSLLYYDQRVRKEAFDLDLMIEALEQKRNPSQAEGHTASL